MRHIDKADFVAVLESTRKDYQKNYFAMYSSLLGGIVTDPILMILPVDDHVVHRGDGIFEAFKCRNGLIYNMQAHLDRLAGSIRSLAYHLPCAPDAIASLVIETVRAGGHRDCLIRILVSRGPGGFGVNPYECPQAQLYITATTLPPSFMTAHPDGAKVVTSLIPIKPAFFAGIKACNYLPNALMKKEAVDAGADFAVGFDEQGCLAEGATENFGIVTGDKRLLFPSLNNILPGTTMLRVAELSQSLVKQGILRKVEFTAIPKQAVVTADEILIVGTTPDVTAVVQLDGKAVGGGKPGPVQKTLAALLSIDMTGNAKVLTTVFPDAAK